MVGSKASEHFEDQRRRLLPRLVALDLVILWCRAGDTTGRHIVVDPEICHGQPTFVGTRVRVSQVLKQVASGMDWDKIVWQWRGTVPRDAIAEAVQLAGRAFEKQNHF